MEEFNVSERKTFLDYIAQAFLTFGVSIFLITCLSLLFGEDTKEISDMFRLGSQGLPADTILQFFVISFLITGLNFLFFGGRGLRRLSFPVRVLLFLLSIIAVASVFILLFHWFPAGMWQPWIMFFFCFGLSACGGAMVTLVKLKQDNQKMSEKLALLQQSLEAESRKEEYNE